MPSKECVWENPLHVGSARQLSAHSCIVISVAIVFSQGAVCLDWSSWVQIIAEGAVLPCTGASKHWILATASFS